MNIWQMRLAPACAQADIRAVGAPRSQASGTLTTGNPDKPSGEGMNPKAPSSRLTPIPQFSVRHRMRHDHRTSPCMRIDVATTAKLAWEIWQYPAIRQFTFKCMLFAAIWRMHLQRWMQSEPCGKTAKVSAAAGSAAMLRACL